MKRIAILLTILAAIMTPVSTFAAGTGAPRVERGGTVGPIAYWIVSTTSPGTFRRGGPNTVICDNSGDEVEWQAIIAKAEAATEPAEIIVAPGRYDFDNPVYIGYAGGLVEQNEGCSIIGQGKVEITYTGTEVTDCGTFMLNVAPSNFNVGMKIANLHLLCDGKVNGLFVSHMNRGEVSHIQIRDSKYIGLLANDAWFGKFSDITIGGGEGAGALFLRCNAAVITRLIHHGADNTNIPDIHSYYGDAWSDTWDETFEPLETLTTITDGGEKAIFLGYMSQPNPGRGTRIVVAYTDDSADGEFDNDEELLGGTSAGTATLKIDGDNEGYDVTAGVFITASQFSLRDYAPENLDYDGDPLLLVMAHGGHVDGIRFENVANWPVGSPDNPADTLIYLNECYGVTISNVQGFASPNSLVGYNARVVTGTRTIDTFDNAGLGAKLVEGDSVFIWDDDGFVKDGVYTVSAGPASGTFQVDEAIADSEDADSAWFYAITLAERLSPAVIVEMKECRGCTVRNLSYKACLTSLVTIDSACINCTADTVRDSFFEGSLNNDFWMTFSRPTQPVLDEGSQTKVRNLQIRDTGRINIATYGGLNDAVQELTETDGTTFKTTLVLHRLSLAVTDLAADPDGKFSELIYTFPEGRIVVTGVTVDLNVSAVSDYDVDGDIGDTASGAIALGTTADADGAIAGSEEDLCPETAFTLVSGVKAVPAALAATTAHFDGTGTAIKCYLNGNFTGIGSVADDTEIGVYGTVTITWVHLGDY